MTPLYGMRRKAKSWNSPLGRTKRLKPISDKRKADLPRESLVRKQLVERAGGIWIPDSHCLFDGFGVGDHCEICGKPPDWRGMHPHEVVKRSKRGKVSLENSLWACLRETCHNHSKYPNGIPLSIDDALELIKKLNKKFEEEKDETMETA